MKYLTELANISRKIDVRDMQKKSLPLEATILKICRMVVARNSAGNKAVFIGNGGSASIASHIATDFLKNASVSAVAFNDASLLTCLSNDLGYEYVFQRPIEMLGKKNDMLFAVSSSGASKNIINAVCAARKKRFYVVTLSGFNGNNPLRGLGDINFYVPSFSYGYVEIIHLVICHAIADRISASKKHHG